MLNDLLKQLRAYDMACPGDRVICAVSGGADSMALLWGMYLLKDKLGITVEAAHFNHRLRGAESERDEAFVREFCGRFEIPLHIGGGDIRPGKKGLEAAAREARYGFFADLSGKVATAHTADDNAETVLMHLVRGTGLKGLGGIAPVNGKYIRPMLTVTRQQVLAFLEEYHISYVEDSSNGEDGFLRNRLRHHVMPLLKRENPKLAENVSRMALRLREDEEALATAARCEELLAVEELKALPHAIRSRMLEQYLKDWGVKEPESQHIALAESLIFSDNPSAEGKFPGGVTVRRNYDRLEKAEEEKNSKWRITCTEAQTIENTDKVFTVRPVGQVVVRSRQGGDKLRLSGGTKSIKKLFIDKKIPAAQRMQIPVIADDAGVLGVYGIGVNLDRAAKKLPAVRITLEKSSEKL